MRKIIYSALVLLMAMGLLTGCKKENAEEAASSVVEQISAEDYPKAPESEEEPVEEEESKAKEVPAGMYLSELTGEPIDEALENQRPVAVMVDNESIALPHYGTAEADVVYEIMNSTANDRITRLMVIVKDWEKITQLGSIRSTRPTNIILASEWNAVLCHDGGPFYNNPYFANAWAEHFSGTFGRVNNGKSREFTEYILTGDLDKNFSNSGYSREYNEFRPDEKPHFNFTPWGTEVVLSETYDSTKAATDISLPFKHNRSRLKYNEETKTYDYYEYGDVHKDAEDNEVLTFKNVFLQCSDFLQYDQNGYLIYDCIALTKPGYYITNGEAKLVYWSKGSETDVTRFYDENNEEIMINTGKTYISLVPSDTWDSITFE